MKSKSIKGKSTESIPEVVEKTLFDKISIENLDLREVIKQSTVELEQKNRELEVETALERIRVKAVAMKASSDLLNIIVTMHNEFIKLGHKAHYFWHMMWLPKTYKKAMTSGDGTKIGFVMELPRHIHGDISLLAKWEKSKKPSVVYAMDADEAIAYVDKMLALGDFKNIDPQAPTHDDIKRIGGLTFIMARTTHGEIGYSLPGVVKNPPKVDIDVLVKFAGAFDLAHQRFLDLQKAEAQTHETEIELALEKVRSRSMAMQKSDELLEAGELLYKELNKLGIDNLTTGYVLFNADAKIGYSYGVNPVDGSIRDFPVEMPHNETSIMKSIVKSWKNEKPSLIIELNEEETIKHQTFIAERSKNFPISAEKLLAISPDRLKIHTFNFKQGYLLLIGSNLLTKAEQKLVVRFAKVFEQTYTRFLDLQKAEAQARESEIELGLERLRAKAMAMQSSNELSYLVATLLYELTNLDFSLTFCIINIYNEPDLSNTVWAANPEEGKAPESYYLKFEDYPFHHAMVREWKAQTPKFVYVIEGEEKEIYDDYLFTETEFRRFPKEVQDANRALDKYVASFVFSPFGGLQTVGNEPLSDESLDILYRFGKVFNQTYTRFLDLQKAEAQAREAQIEMALEKVRSRTMAMQHSEELPEAANLLFTEVQKLGIPAWSCGYNILADDKKSSICIMSSEGELQTPFVLPLTKHKSLKPWYKAIKNNADFFVYNQDGKDLVEHYDYMKSLPDLKATFKQLEDAGLELPTQQYNHLVKFNEGFLLFITYEEVPEAHDIFRRFGKVFNQTYTRFLDLQKAEAQAREAQIEAALERVRSKSMAMHKSEEIGDVAFVLFEQLKSLGGELWGTGFAFCKKDSGVDEFWFANENGIMPHLKIPNTIDEVHKKMYQGWEQNLELFSIEKGGKELKDHYKYMLTVPDVQPIFQDILDSGISFPKWQKWYAAYFKYGYLLVITIDSYENEAIFKRFAKVFEQAYTRFLDLQKAEAQAREAKVEAAMERIRSRSMAMQKSEELNDVILEIHKKFKELDISMESRVAIVVVSDPDSKDFNQYIAAHDLSNIYISTPYFKHPVLDDYFEAKEAGVEFFSKSYTEKEKNSYFKTFFETSNLDDIEGIEDQKKWVFAQKFYTHSQAFQKNSCIGIADYSGIPLTEFEIDIIIRFSKVFDQAYTRFLDLQKAEAQTRDAQINLAVERVRAKALAMHKSEEILGVIAKLKDEVMALDIPDVIASTIFLKEGTDNIRMWDLSSLEENNNGYEIPFDITFKLKKRDPNLYIKRIWENPEDYFIEIQNKKDFIRIIGWLREQNESKFASEVETFIDETKLKYLHHAVKKLNNGKLVIDLLNPPSEEMETILTKMGAAFDLAYKRFEDLQKAEAQTREAQIQLALERVRARTMAMQHSDELVETSELLFQQIKDLGIELWSCGYSLWYDDDSYFIGYNPMPNGKMGTPLKIPLTEDVFFKTIRKAKRKGEKFLVFESKGKSLVKTYQYMDKLPVVGEAMRGIVDAGFELPKYQVTHCGFFTYGHLMFITHCQYPEAHDIFKRFTKEFEQAYTRFLDLQKAEVQARDAQIETALERVRAQSNAMHKSDDLAKVVTVVYDELDLLDKKTLRCGIGIISKKSKSVNVWVTTDISSGKSVELSGHEPLSGHQLLDHIFDSWKKQENLIYVLEGKDLIDYYKTIENIDFQKQFAKQGLENAYIQHYYCTMFPAGGLFVFETSPITEEKINILQRFSDAFNRAYTRHRDLQKAEAQAREAQIEAALERVRSRSMAMHNSEELKEVIQILYDQFIALKINIEHAGIILDYKNQKDMHIVLADKNSVLPEVRLPYFDCAHWNSFKKAKKNNESLFTNQLDFEEKIKFYKDLFKHIPDLPKETIDHYLKVPGLAISTVLIDNIGLYIENFNGIPYSDEENEILLRFGKVFQQTYTRFLDLQKAETQAREAQIEASLEKVRNVALGLKRSDDMLEIAQALYEQLLELGFKDIRNAIIDVNNEDEETFLDYDYSHEMGGTITSMSYSDDPTMEEQLRVIANTTDGYSEMVLKGEQLQNLIDMRRKNGEADDPRLFSTDSVSYILYAFGNGAIGISNFGILNDTQKRILHRFRNVFIFAYKRYTGLAQAEAQSIALMEEKQRLEKTLSDLQATQKQLIQSEKMASLGELTAGIAHEIQNPLNFVNNFSEVSKELLDEMLEGIEAGDMKEVKAIMADVIQNLEKINHHGQRADGIVKGMLQHSRASTNKKEVTDINALADEYLRLACHGLRAKDKLFNVHLKTDYDENIKSINIIPQDIGLVILNLLNNAFYAVKEKKQLNLNGYNPTVWMSTKKYGDRVEIKIKDNGNGMPEHVKEKIFQPFFTTKPTGKGTGLGLSLSYDIIKAHSSEIKVKTKMGEGTILSILLKINQ